MFAVFICVVAVLTGTLNTLLAKWVDSIKADGKVFNHPFLQSFCMFVGESLCLIVYVALIAYKRRQWRKALETGSDVVGLHQPGFPRFNALIFIIPTVCDITASCLLYTGLTLTTASSYQMLRGAVIVFTGILSRSMLGIRLAGFKWIGMLLVTLGLVVVGLTDILFENKHAENAGLGNTLIIIAQVVIALHMVFEQKFLDKYDVPALLAVGLEGVFGVVIMSGVLVVCYYIQVSDVLSTNPQHRLEDVFYAWKQIQEVPTIGYGLLATIVSIAFFNFAGVSVTKELSATTRMVLDSVRTLTIWAISIPLFGEKFIAYQLIGCMFLLLGMFVYNDLVFGPWFRDRLIPAIQERNPDAARRWLRFCGGEENADDESRAWLVEGGRGNNANE